MESVIVLILMALQVGKAAARGGKGAGRGREGLAGES